MQKLKYFQILFIFIFSSFMGNAQSAANKAAVKKGLLDKTEDKLPTTPITYQLVWSDEFNIDGALDTTKWFHQTQLPTGGNWFNGEIQHYTRRVDNSFVDNGILKILAKKETFTDQGVTKDFTSARLNSKFSFKYGKIEVRAKLPFGVGTWPAIWTLGKNIIEDGAYWDNLGYGNTAWPACGEIDIMEHWGSNQNYVQSATHTPSSYGGTVNVGGRSISNVSTAFHLYTLEWTSDKLVFSVDSIVHYTYNPPIKNASTWPFDLEQYLLLNVAILPNIDTSFISSAMEIDYVRIYQETNVSIGKIKKENPINIYPNPFSNELNINLNHTSGQSVTINIFSLDGRLIHNYSTSVHSDKIRINNLDNLEKGVYIIKITEGKNERNIKVVKI